MLANSYSLQHTDAAFNAMRDKPQLPIQEDETALVAIGQFAGGIDEDRLTEVLGAGATRVVVVRAITGAEDPGASAARLAAALRRAAPA